MRFLWDQRIYISAVPCFYSIKTMAKRVSFNTVAFSKEFHHDLPLSNIKNTSTRLSSTKSSKAIGSKLFPRALYLRRMLQLAYLNRLYLARLNALKYYRKQYNQRYLARNTLLKGYQTNPIIEDVLKDGVVTERGYIEEESDLHADESLAIEEARSPLSPSVEEKKSLYTLDSSDDFASDSIPRSFEVDSSRYQDLFEYNLVKTATRV